jgi:uracil phosphoribosyltransferase
MDTLTVIDHPLIKRDLTLLRDRNTGNSTFRAVLRRIASCLAYEVTRTLGVRTVRIATPLEECDGHVMAEQTVIVPVLRAGLGLVDGFLNIMPDAAVGHIGMYRNERTLQPVDYYSKFPQHLESSEVFLLDPMLATGGSGSAAISFLKEKGARRVRFVSLLAAPEGVRKVSADHPDVPLFTTVLDRQLNDRGYILPGLGDAGDRLFGT